MLRSPCPCFPMQDEQTWICCRSQQLSLDNSGLSLFVHFAAEVPLEGFWVIFLAALRFQPSVQASISLLNLHLVVVALWKDVFQRIAYVYIALRSLTRLDLQNDGFQPRSRKWTSIFQVKGVGLTFRSKEPNFTYKELWGNLLQHNADWL